MALAHRYMARSYSFTCRHHAFYLPFALRLDLEALVSYLKKRTVVVSRVWDEETIANEACLEKSKPSCTPIGVLTSLDQRLPLVSVREGLLFWIRFRHLLITGHLNKVNVTHVDQHTCHGWRASETKVYGWSVGHGEYSTPEKFKTYAQWHKYQRKCRATY